MRSVTSRELVIDRVTKSMREAYYKGDLIDAQNMDSFVRSLESMTDEVYDNAAAAAEGIVTVVP